MCGYCGRRLQQLTPGRGWQCPRCGPLLDRLGAGLPLDAALAAYRRFIRDAALDSVPPGGPEQLALPLAPADVARGTSRAV